MTNISVRKLFLAGTLTLFGLVTVATAQEPASTGGWRRVGEPQTQTQAQTEAPTDAVNPQMSQSAPNGPTASPSSYPESSYPQDNQHQAPQPQYPAQRPAMPQQQQGGYAQIPTQISVPAGTYLTVRVNQLLSSDHNQTGDAFSATLVKPLVANGVVLAEPGATIGGRVAQAQKAGRVEGLAKLGIELTDLAIVDGQQLPIKTTLISRTGNSSVGRDAGAIAGTTALGAAVGAAADWGRGAAIGAGAGAAAGIIGVLVTRGQPSVIYPEQTLTFRLEQPLSISTERSPQAFRYVQPNEYAQLANNPAPYPPAPVYAYGAPGYAYAPVPYYYGYPYYPYSGFSLFVGPGFYGRGYYGGGRFYGGFGGPRFRR